LRGRSKKKNYHKNRKQRLEERESARPFAQAAWNHSYTLQQDLGETAGRPANQPERENGRPRQQTPVSPSLSLTTEKPGRPMGPKHIKMDDNASIGRGNPGHGRQGKKKMDIGTAKGGRDGTSIPHKGKERERKRNGTNKSALFF
jgi:hypothetical protein